jgi:glucokinase
MPDYVVGIDLGGTKIMGAVVDAKGKMVSRVMKLTQAERGPVPVLDRIVDVIKEAVSASAGGPADRKRIGMDNIAAIGIGSPGPLDPDKGIVVFTPNLPGWRDIHVVEYVEKATGKKVFMDNDVKVGVLGEQAFGAGRGVRTLIGLFVGTGIGGGVIIRGKLHRGFSKQAGELGHTVIDYKGPKCGCGQSGCLEAMASRQAMCRKIAEQVKAGKETVIRETDPMQITTRMMVDALRKKDKVVTDVMTDALEILGIGIASISHVVSPEMVIIGGGIVDALDDEMMDVIVNSAKKRALPLVMDNVKFVRASLGEDAGVLGASVLARQGLTGER